MPRRACLRLEVPTGKIDRSMGDIHPQGNPHYWLDPLNMRIVAKNVAARLSKLDAAHCRLLRRAAQGVHGPTDEAMFGPKLIAAAGQAAGSPDQGGAKAWALLLKGELDTFVRTTAATRSSADGGERCDRSRARRSSPTTGAGPTSPTASDWTSSPSWSPNRASSRRPSHLNDVLNIIEQQKVRFLLMEPFYSRQAADWLEKKTGIKVVQVANSVGGQPEATDYIAMIDNIVDAACRAARRTAALGTIGVEDCTTFMDC